MTITKQTAYGVCFMNKRHPNSQEHEDCQVWQRRKTRLLWPMWPSTRRIGKDIKVSSWFFNRGEADVISEAFLTAMTGYRHEELAAMDLRMITVALTPSWLARILTVMPVWLNFSSFLFYSVFFFEHETIYASYTSVNCVWKPPKLWLSISFSLWGFSSLLKLK